MAPDNPEDKRRYPRFDTQVDIRFQVDYDIRTKVEYQKIDKKEHKALSEKYSALSQNVSAEGLCFKSAQKLEEGSYLFLEVYVPSSPTPVCMEGEVRWSQHVYPKRDINQYLTGIKLTMINGKRVADTIYFDKAHQLVWSDVLESTLGKYRIIGQKRNT